MFLFLIILLWLNDSYFKHSRSHGALWSHLPERRLPFPSADSTFCKPFAILRYNASHVSLRDALHFVLSWSPLNLCSMCTWHTLQPRVVVSNLGQPCVQPNPTWHITLMQRSKSCDQTASNEQDEKERQYKCGFLKLLQIFNFSWTI